MADHIHMLVSIPPKMSVSSFMGYLKGKSALMIFDRHANLKYKKCRNMVDNNVVLCNNHLIRTALRTK